MKPRILTFVLTRLWPVAILAAVVLWPGPCGLSADVVYLKNKTAVRGQVVAQDENTVTLKVYYGQITIQREHIDHIEKEDVLDRLMAEGDRLMMEGDEAGAQRVYAEIVARFPDSTMGARKLAAITRKQVRMLLAAQKVTEAEVLLKRLVELEPNDEFATTELARIQDIRKDAPALEQEAVLLARTGRGRESLAIFDRLVQVMPEVEARDARFIAMAHVVYADHLVPAGQFKEATDQYSRAVALDPDVGKPLEQKRVLARLQPVVREINQHVNDMSRERWVELADELAGLEKMAPGDQHTAFMLGVVYQQLGRNRDAAERFARVAGAALSGDPVEALPKLFPLAEKWSRENPLVVSFDESPWTTAAPVMKVLETEHFDIRYYNRELADLTGQAAEYFYERIYRELTGGMPKTPWPRKCGIYLYRTPEEYLEQSKREAWSPASAQTTARDGVLRDHRIMTSQLAKDLLSSHIPHELTHIIQAAMLDYSTEMPSWLREGTAVHFEPWFKHRYLAEILTQERNSDKFFQLEDLVQTKGYPEESRVSLFYAESVVLVEALLKSKDLPTFQRFCRLSLVRPFHEAVQGAYGMTEEEVRKLWEERMDAYQALPDH